MSSNKSIKDLIGTKKGHTAIIIGAGGTLREHGSAIKYLSEKKRTFTIGINRMTDVCVPTFHLWTNSGRYREFGSCISPKSSLLFGCNIKKKLIKKHFSGEYTNIDYIDKEGVPFGFSLGKITGHYRTAGCLAIKIAHLMGANPIYVSGMDGYTFNPKSDLEDGNSHQHIYGSGYTDGAKWEECIRKDDMVYRALKGMSKNGIEFSLITPTRFASFYNKDVLGL